MTIYFKRNGNTQWNLFPNSGMDNDISTVQTINPVILVAETELTSRTSLSELLREEGYRVIEAGDSSTAVSHLTQESNINVILTDLEMPSWTSIIHHARSQLPESFILGMLRYGALANGLEAQRLGAQGYLIKPLDFAEVQQWIRRCLTGQSRIII
jgi:CheY-like chemotaxis protein